MKKLILSALLAAAALSASAADRVVYANGALGPYAVYGWWNNAADFAAANPTDDDAKVFSFKAADGGAAASMGINAEAPEVVTGPLHSATLEFDWYATTAGQTYTVRLTSLAEENYAFKTTADNIGKWNHTALKVSEVYPTVAAQWNDYVKKGQGYVFGIILEGGVAESVIYFDNIKYTGLDEAWVTPEIEELPAPTTVPVPDVAADRVISLLGSAYPAATTFNFGGWGQTTQPSYVDIDGKRVLKVTNFNYLGWELAQHIDVTSCNAMHVDFFAANEGKFGFTPISPGAEKAYIADNVKVGEWNSYDVPLSYWDNVNFADVFQIKFDQGNTMQEGYIANVYFYNDPSINDPSINDPSINDPEYGATWYGTVEGSCVKGDKTYNITIDYAFTANENGTLTIEMVTEGEDDLDAGHQAHVVANGDEWVTLTKDGESWIGTTTKTFTLGQSVNEIELYLPYANGVYHPFIRDYVFGASNTAPAKDPSLRLTAEATGVTSDAATITYNLRASNHFDGVDVKVLLDGTTAITSPYTLTGLTPSTEYTYTLLATATLDGVTYTSDPVTVTFKTSRDGATATVWHGIADGFIPNAFYVGEEASAKRSLPVSIYVTATHNLDQTLTIEASVRSAKEIVGIVAPNVVAVGEPRRDNQPDHVPMAGNYANATYTTTGIYEEGDRLAWFTFDIIYADGGFANIATLNKKYTIGDENDEIVLGAPARLDAAITKTSYLASETGYITAIALDANGHFLFNEPLTYIVDGDAFEVSADGLVTALDRGDATITVKCGDLTYSVNVTCMGAATAQQLTGTATASAACNNIALAVDGNEATQAEWNCSETEEHWMQLDLGEVRHIQAVEIVWEGASATQYTVTLSPNPVVGDTPAARAPVMYAEETYTPLTIDVTDGQGGAGVIARKVIQPKATENALGHNAQYITIQTSKAFDPGWGIKLKEVKAYGDLTPSGVADVNIDLTDAPATYYNLQGVEITGELAPGLYIRRQGNTATKIIVK